MSNSRSYFEKNILSDKTKEYIGATDSKKHDLRSILWEIKRLTDSLDVALLLIKPDNYEAFNILASTSIKATIIPLKDKEIIRDVLKDHDDPIVISANKEILPWENYSSYTFLSKHKICFPFISRENVIGCLVLCLNNFSELIVSNEKYLESLVSITSLNVENIYLNERINIAERDSQSIQEVVRDGVVVFNSNGKALSINKSAVKLLNLKSLGEDDGNISYPSIIDLTENPKSYIKGRILYFFDPVSLFNNTLKTGNTYSGLYSITGNSIRYVRVYFNLVNLSDSNKYIYMTLRDITRSRLQQNQLYTMYKTGMDIVISDNSESPIAEVAQNAANLFDSQFAEVYLYNKHLKQLEFAGGIGYNSGRSKVIKLGEGLLGKSAKERIPVLANNNEDVNTPRHSIIVPLLQGRHLLGILHVGDNRKKKFFTEEESTALILFGSQAAVAIKTSSYIKELTIRKERLETIFNNIAEGISITNLNKKIISFNPAAEEITGWNAKDAIGQSYSKVFTETDLTDQNEYDSLIDRAVKTKKSIPYREVILTTRQREKKFVEISFIPQKNEQGEVVGVVKVTRDISKYKEVDQLKNDFVSIASHELRTPLTVINGYLNLFFEGYLGPLDDNQRKFLEKIYNDTTDLTRLVEDLLNVSRIEGNRLKLNISPFDLVESMKKVIDGLKNRADSKGILVNAVFPDKHLNIIADKRKVEQVILNLLDNSIKYTQTGGEVEILAKYSKNGIIITVKDNGVGINKDYKDKIFGKFQRIPNPLSNKEGGTGLGLYITQGFVVAHHGYINYKRRRKGGSIFEVWLPLKYKE